MQRTMAKVLLSSLLGMFAAASAIAAEGHIDTADQNGPPKVIRWRTDLLTAYQEAVAENKPLAIVFLCPLERDECIHCKRMRGSIFHESTQEFADDAVFVVALIRGDGASDDEAAATLYSRLQVKATPAISIIEPKTTVIEERARIAGYFPAHKLYTHLHRFLKEYAVAK
ncbi:MAG: hypothetical protein RIC55_22765 [Pirellulaceae bacterium]